MKKNSKPPFPQPFPEPLTVSEAAVDIENYARGGNINSSNIQAIQALIDVFKKYQPKANSKISPSLYIQFYDPLVRAIKKSSNKDIRDTSELALEMKVLISELETIKFSAKEKKVSKKIIPFLCQYSQELVASNYPILM